MTAPTTDITGIVAHADLDEYEEAPSLEVSGVTFADFPILPEIVEALRDVGIISPFPIQAMTLPVALDGRDIIGQAKTGTGKTLGFGLPLLSHVVAPGEEGWDTLHDAGKPQALVSTVFSRRFSLRSYPAILLDELHDSPYFQSANSILNRSGRLSQIARRIVCS